MISMNFNSNTSLAIFFIIPVLFLFVFGHKTMYTLRVWQLQLNSMFYLTNRFQVAMRLFSNRSQMTSKCGKNEKVAYEAQPSVSLMFLPHFDVLSDLLLNRHTTTWNLFVLYNRELKKVLMMTSSMCLSSIRS